MSLGWFRAANAGLVDPETSLATSFELLKLTRLLGGFRVQGFRGLGFVRASSWFCSVHMRLALFLT